MKKIIPFLIIVLAAVAFYFRGLWLPPPPGQMNYLGYVEGETVLIAAPVAGRIVSVNAVKGGSLKAGDAVFSLDGKAAAAEAARSEAAVRTAEATASNLLTGKRAVELAIYAAQRQEIEAALDMAKKEMQRAATLTSSGAAAQSRLDQAESQIGIYEARLAQIAANEKAATLPSRDFEIEAAQSRIAEARSSAAEARQKLADLTPLSPADARVDDVYFDAGEWVAAGQPVVALLPPGAVTLRFFVPEAVAALARPGTSITFTCDGCGDAQTATITRVASQPEYTPPVIYSQGARSKLVFLVEAKPGTSGAGLPPGLPIEVEPLQ